MSTRSVLLVDDDEDFARVVSGILQELSPPFAVQIVDSGTEALAVLCRARPAFVVLDFRLPEMNAPAVLEKLRGSGHSASTVPVLVLSQSVWRQDETAARIAGANHVELKPTTVAALRSLLIQFIEERCT